MSLNGKTVQMTSYVKKPPVPSDLLSAQLEEEEDEADGDGAQGDGRVRPPRMELVGEDERRSAWERANGERISRNRFFLDVGEDPIRILYQIQPPIELEDDVELGEEKKPKRRRGKGKGKETTADGPGLELEDRSILKFIRESSRKDKGKLIEAHQVRISPSFFSLSYPI